MKIKEEFMPLFFEYDRSAPPLYDKKLHTQVSHKTWSGS